MITSANLNEQIQRLSDGLISEIEFILSLQLSPKKIDAMLAYLDVREEWTIDNFNINQKSGGIEMGNNNMATYQFSNAELQIIIKALELGKDEAVNNVIWNKYNNTQNTINQILAARNSRG